MRRLVLALLLLATPAAGQSRPAARIFSQEDLKKAETARDAALARVRKLEAASASASRDLAAIDRDMLAAAADATAREEAAYAAEEQLMLLADESQTASATLISDQAAMEDLLAALMTFGSRRPPALAASPDDVSGAVRAAILMSDTAPALKARAEDLRKRLAAIKSIAAATRAQQEYLASATGALDARRQEISALAEEKRRAQAHLDAETAAAALLLWRGTTRFITATLVSEPMPVRGGQARVSAAMPGALVWRLRRKSGPVATWARSPA